jgi:hypothetical protein
VLYGAGAPGVYIEVDALLDRPPDVRAIAEQSSPRQVPMARCVAIMRGTRSKGGIGKKAHADFRQDLMRARELRGDFSFGERILDIADNDDRQYKEKTGKPSMNKELVLRSKIRIEARQFHMSRLHPQQWGERQQLDVPDDWALLTEDERGRKADELIQIIRESVSRPCSRRTWFIDGKRRLRSVNRAESVANLDRERLGRADGARSYCHCCCEDSARSLDRGRRQPNSGRANAPSTPTHFFVARLGFARWIW